MGVVYPFPPVLLTGVKLTGNHLWKLYVLFWKSEPAHAHGDTVTGVHTAVAHPGGVVASLFFCCASVVLRHDLGGGVACFSFCSMLLDAGGWVGCLELQEGTGIAACCRRCSAFKPLAELEDAVQGCNAGQSTKTGVASGTQAGGDTQQNEFMEEKP